MRLSEGSVFVIAEAGVNHNGSVESALEMIDVAKDAGANAIKFQTFDSQSMVTQKAKKARYQQNASTVDETQGEMLSRLQLDKDAHYRLKDYAEECGLMFMSTAFDSKSLKFLANDLDLNPLKIPSGEITNGPLLLEFGQTKRDLILSTGMSTLDEVRSALSVLAFGLVFDGEPSIERFEKAFKSDEGQNALKARVTILHCTSQYPAPLRSVNLRAIKTIKKRFGLRVGYSDHTSGILIAGAAVALGAGVIEKHFTLDRSLAGPDHQASLLPSELKDLILNIRSIECAMGDGQKLPQEEEQENRDIARKSLVVTTRIENGEEFSSKNISTKRPGTGRSPMCYWDVVGSRAEKIFEADDLL